MKNFFEKLKEKLASLKKKKKADGTAVATDDISVDDSVETSGEEAKPKTEEKKPKNKKKIITIILIVIFTLSFFFGGGYFAYQYFRDFPKVEAAGNKFFKLLRKKRYNQTYMSMTKSFREKVNEKEFKFSILGSSYLFENILKVEADENRYVKKGKRFKLQGKVIYKDKSEGTFKLILIKGKVKKRSTYLVDGFEVVSKSNEKKVRKMSYKAVLEFLKTLSGNNLNSFKGFFHPSVEKRMGKEAGVRFHVMHSKHKEAGYTNHTYLEKDVEVKYNTQITYTGTSKTKLGSEFIGKITVYYDKGSWHIIGFSFQPKN
ncbi:MAG: hypothetical protein COB02_02700 [Candidatus Cloacimonadota bacterium]|nr:MAG: hypothetical protein COB02_02700 [Candidatus Cloacimonadota bacterium]